MKPAGRGGDSPSPPSPAPTPFAVTSRAREVGIRICLGAGKSALLRDVMGRGLGLMAVGSGFGVLLGMVVSRLTGLLPFDLQPPGPGTLLGVALLMMAVGGMAALNPIRRLLRMDGMAVIRVGGRE